MREPRLVQDYLQDILDAMDKAENFTFSMDLNTFRIDDITAFSVIRTLEIIGEAAKKYSSRSMTPFPKYPSLRTKFVDQMMKVQADEV